MPDVIFEFSALRIAQKGNLFDFIYFGFFLKEISNKSYTI